MRAGIVAFALLVTPMSRGQKSEQPVPIGWFSVKSIGTWVDESDPKSPRVLKRGDPIYRSSKLVRRDPTTSTDSAYISLPDASYASFPCLQPLVCDQPLDLTKVAQSAEPHLPTFRRVINSMSGRRRAAHLVLKDAVVEFSASLSTGIVFSDIAKGGQYSFALCLKALDQKCPDEPVPITTDWDPQKPSSLISLANVAPGLHRLILLKQAEGEWFYTEEDAYLLVVGGKNSKSRAERASDALRILQIETESQRSYFDDRARVMTLLQIESDAIP